MVPLSLAILVVILCNLIKCYCWENWAKYTGAAFCCIFYNHM